MNLEYAPLLQVQRGLQNIPHGRAYFPQFPWTISNRYGTCLEQLLDHRHSWSSGPSSEQAVSEAILAAAFRMAYVQRHRTAHVLLDKLTPDGDVTARTVRTVPILDADDLAYMREVLNSYLDAEDMRTTIEFQYGNAAAHTLGFMPHGLSPQAALAVAFTDTWFSSQVNP